MTNGVGLKMSKKNVLIIALVAIVVIVVLVGQKEKIASLVENKKTEKVVDLHNEIEKSLIESEEESRQEALKEDVSLKLSNQELSPEDKIRTILEMDVSKKENVVALLNFIVSENPYTESNDPHSVDNLRFEKEASLRIYGIRKLSENLALKDFSEIVWNIKDRSESETIKKVAQEALKSKEQGRNYFTDTIKAIEEMPVGH